MEDHVTHHGSAGESSLCLSGKTSQEEPNFS